MVEKKKEEEEKGKKSLDGDWREGREHTVNNLKHLILSFTERLPEQRSQLKSLTH